MHELVVGDRQFDDSSGHLGRHRDDIDPHVPSRVQGASI